MKKGFIPLPEINQDVIKRQGYFFLFETGLFNKDNRTSYIFIKPVDIIRIYSYKEVPDAFRKIEEYSKSYYLTGYFSYELGYLFEKGSFKNARQEFDFALIHLAVFKNCLFFNHKTGRTNIPAYFFAKPHRRRGYKIQNLRFNLSGQQYKKKLNRVKEYIKRGDTYEVNFTGRFGFDFKGPAFSLYQDLKNKQHTSYGAFCKFKDEAVISLSPELFFKREGLRIFSRPMKGTIKRGEDIYKDTERIKELQTDKKSQAENLMIVDLLRNDLGRICQTGSMKAPRLFDVEKYDTLFQMTSAIEGVLKKDISYLGIFRSIFPGGSVTGAPKIRTMQIIRELEIGYRKVYCGALGIISPGQKAIFNLPIRTVRLLKGKAEMGVGSGVVIDSTSGDEYDECLLKAKFLTQTSADFELIETMLWDSGFKFLKQHLKRLCNSAEYFDFRCDIESVKKQLKKIKADLRQKGSYKIRLLLDKSGRVKLSYSQIKKTGPDIKRYVAVSKYRVNPQDIFLYHKTTNRKPYDSEYRRYSNKGYSDVIFLNNRNEVTEGAISNVIIRKANKYFTPPAECGLLKGVFRDFLIKNRRVEEKVLYKKDLLSADNIYLCNSVRGLVRVEFNFKKRDPSSLFGLLRMTS